MWNVSSNLSKMSLLKDLTLKRNIFYADEFHLLEKIKINLKPCDPHSGACLNNVKCTNFIDNMECPAICSKKVCNNRRIGTDLGRFNLEQRLYAGKGYGVRTLEDIPAVAFVLEYVGFIRTGKEYEEMWHNHPSKPFYGMDYEGGFVIDATKEGNLSRLFNHSCAPTLCVEQWYSDSGLPRIILVAIENIKKGDELTYDYNAVNFKGTADMVCKCGKSNCKYIQQKRLENSDELKMTCSICPMDFGSMYALKRHENTTHNAEAMHKCPKNECTKKFKRMDALKRHLKFHESEEKLHKCDKCDKRFRLKQHLKEHTERHLQTGTKYKCGEKRLDKNKRCKKVFLCKRTLQAHRRLEHRC